MLLAEPSEAPPRPRDPLGIGEKVRHAKFGTGEVTAVASDAKLTIQFADQSRMLLARFVTPI